MGSAHDDFIDHHGGDGCAGNGIHGDRTRVTGVADNHPLADLDPFVAGAETVEFFFGNADQQNRLMVFQDIGILNHTGGVEDHLSVDRFARVGRNVHHVQALEDKTDDLAGCRHRPHVERAVGRGNGVGLREDLLDALLLNVAVRLGLYHREHREHQQDHDHQTDAPDAQVARYRRRMDCHEWADFKGSAAMLGSDKRPALD